MVFALFTPSNNLHSTETHETTHSYSNIYTRNYKITKVIDGKREKAKRESLIANIQTLESHTSRKIIRKYPMGRTIQHSKNWLKD